MALSEAVPGLAGETSQYASNIITQLFRFDCANIMMNHSWVCQSIFHPCSNDLLAEVIPFNLTEVIPFNTCCF